MGSNIFGNDSHGAYVHGYSNGQGETWKIAYHLALRVLWDCEKAEDVAGAARC